MNYNVREFAIGVHPILEKFLELEERRCHDRPYLKSTNLALNARAWGKSFNYNVASDLPKALFCFNQCIAHAPPDSEELALGFAERSTVLFLQKKYDLALLDLNRALQGSLSSNQDLRDSLLKRRQNCWQKLQKERSGQTFTRSQYEVFRYPISDNIDQTDILSDDSPVYNDPIWNTELNNPLLGKVSKKVKLEYSPEFGRHVIATEDIEQGEILSIDQFFAVIREAGDADFVYCSYCLIWCTALIPCRTCTEEMYCSQRCLKLAYDSYHRTECKILGLRTIKINFDQKKYYIFPLRCFLIGTNQGADLTKLMSDSKILECLQGKSKCVGVKYSLNDYYSVLDLPWKDKIIPDEMNDAVDEGTSKSDGSSNDRSHYSALLTMYARPYLETFLEIFAALKYIHFFCEQGKEETQSAGTLTDREIFACMLLLQHTLALRRRVGPFTRTVFENSLLNIKSSGQGAGGLASLMNHACNANVQSVSSKRWYLCYCLKTIKAGEQIFFDYTQESYRTLCLKERQRYIKVRLLFECRCLACVNEWPIFGDLWEKNMYNFKITNRKKINEIKNMCLWLIELSSSDSTIVERDDENLQTTLKFYKTIYQYVKDPSCVTYVCEELIIAWMYKKGNSYRRALPE